jgi:hypothetical protein
MPTVRGRIDHWKPILIDPHGNRVWIGVEVAPHQRDIAKRCGEEQVGSSPLCDKESCDLEAIANEVLRRSRVVIVIERINLGAMFEQKLSDLDGACEVQRPLAIAAFSMDERWITCD